MTYTVIQYPTCQIWRTVLGCTSRVAFCKESKQDTLKTQYHPKSNTGIHRVFHWHLFSNNSVNFFFNLLYFNSSKKVVIRRLSNISVLTIMQCERKSKSLFHMPKFLLHTYSIYNVKDYSNHFFFYYSIVAECYAVMYRCLATMILNTLSEILRNRRLPPVLSIY